MQTSNSVVQQRSGAQVKFAFSLNRSKLWSSINYPIPDMRLWRIKLDDKSADYAAWTMKTALHRFFLDIDDEEGKSIPEQDKDIDLGRLSFRYLGKQPKKKDSKKGA